MKQRHEGAAAGKPDRCLAGRVSTADHAHAFGAAELRLGRAGGVEDARAFVLLKIVDRQPPVLRAGGDQDRARGDLVILLQPHDVTSVARLQ